jgi:hypothetical protein
MKGTVAIATYHDKKKESNGKINRGEKKYERRNEK